MFYIHPWEMDTEQPTIRKVGWKSSLRHYSGLKRSEARLERLLHEFSFTAMSESIQQWERHARTMPVAESSRVHSGIDSGVFEGAQVF